MKMWHGDDNFCKEIPVPFSDHRCLIIDPKQNGCFFTIIISAVLLIFLSSKRPLGDYRIRFIEELFTSHVFPSKRNKVCVLCSKVKSERSLVFRSEGGQNLQCNLK